MEKINIAELLKDCPRGMELDCVIFNNVTFECVSDDGIWIKYINSDGNSRVLHLTPYGEIELQHIKTKCVIFPKGKTTWEGFQRLFRDGDIVTFDNLTKNHLQIFIFKDKKENNTLSSCYLMLDGDKLVLEEDLYYVTRLATEEEKKKLFDAIKANGYKWNEETKTLEKLPKFKVGDRVKHISAYTSGIVVKVDDKGYCINYPKGEGVCYINFALEKNYELAPNKFDINTLVPFESRVLVRDTDHYEWEGAVFGRYDGNNFFTIGGIDWKYCIPYEGNEHLFGTTNDCDDFYKTWEE